ncbi:MAG: alpha/beta hydrolase, partial [Planctomycetota bacterium]
PGEIVMRINVKVMLLRISRASISLALLAVLLASATTVHATVYDWCALGESFKPGQEFITVRRVRLAVEGEALGDLAAAFSEEILRRRVWPPETEAVHVSPYIDEQCGPANRNADELNLTISTQDVQQMRQELARRGDHQPAPTLQTLASKTHVKKAAEFLGPPETSRINWLRIFYATNRKATGQTAADSAFGSKDAEVLSWGSVDVSIPHAHEMGRLESPSVFRLEWVSDPEKHVTLAPRLTTLTPERWKQELRSRATALDRPGVLLFVHGYNVSFADGARRAAQFAYDIAFSGPTVYFSWPSDGNLLPYMGDETSAFAAKELMADVLQTLTSLEPGLPVYIVAHSMGNRVMLHGLTTLLQREPSAHQALRQVVMASPDVGRREFKQIFNNLAGTKPRYTLYASSKDLPVNISAWLHEEPRVGNGGPNIAVFSGVDSVDASGITQEFFGLNHSYFGDNATLLSDLFTLIHRGFEPKDRHLQGVEAPQGH